MPEQIHHATTADDFAAFGQLVDEYVAWFRLRYEDDPTFAREVFGHQKLSTDPVSLEAAYTLPNGKAFVAIREGEACGIAALRRLGNGACEMKRLFVPQRFQGRGIGRRLGHTVIAAARDAGFTRMRLDSGRLLTEAITMYSSLGFSPCAPYLDYPPALLQGLVFMERPLTD